MQFRKQAFENFRGESYFRFVKQSKVVKVEKNLNSLYIQYLP